MPRSPSRRSGRPRSRPPRSGTRTVSVPVPFSVPANTSSPGSFAAGSGSPVMVAWSTSLAPAITWPSAAIRSPGLTRIMSPASRLGCLDPLFGAVGSKPDGAVRGQVEQAAHGLLGVMGGDRLERSRGREDDDQQAAVEDLPDRGRADRGGDHEQVHVEHPSPQRPQPGQGGLPPARARSRRGAAPTPARPPSPAGQPARPGTGPSRRRPSAPRAATTRSVMRPGPRVPGARYVPGRAARLSSALRPSTNMFT